MGRKIKTIEGVEVIDIGDKGMAIGRAPDGRIVMVEKAVPGDVVDVFVRRKRKGLLQTVTTRTIQYSDQRTTPFCRHFGTCGGCKWQDLDYDAQAHFKEQAVRAALTRIGQVEDTLFMPILKASRTTHYRNKLEFTFTDQRWLTQEEIDQNIAVDRRGLGFHVPGSFARVLDLEECHLQPSPADEIRNFVRSYCVEHDLPFQNIKDRSGALRNLVVRSNAEGKVMVTLILIRDLKAQREALLEALLGQFPQIISLYYCINSKLNDSYFDQEFHLYHGLDKLPMQLGHVRFELGPKSFFQTNLEQARRLYDVAAEFAGLTGAETVYDLYCGIGSISLYLAHQAATVVGIEEVPEAIEDAQYNAQLNEITNATFYAGDVKEILQENVPARHGAPDVIVTDPPRAGMHQKAVELVRDLAPKRIVYVSCNPSTQARDIALLADQYRCVKTQPVDMFPHTSHIENVALLERR